MSSILIDESARIFYHRWKNALVQYSNIEPWIDTSLSDKLFAMLGSPDPEMRELAIIAVDVEYNKIISDGLTKDDGGTF